MKKALLFGLSVTVLLASLTACGTSQADQPTPTPTPSAVQTQPVEPPEPEKTSEPVNYVEQMSVTTTQQEVDTRRLPTEEELLELFQMSYDFGQIFADAGYSEEEALEEEFVELHCLIEMMADFRAPDDLDVQYLTWRVLNHSQKPDATEAPASNPQQLFIECNQTMYATGTVNIRASYSTSSDKLGTLYGGMSVTCIGIGQGEASGWNMVILENGNTAYMVGSYLSTQKPEINIVTGGGGGTTQTNTGTTNTQQASLTQQPASGGLAVDVTGGRSPNDFINKDYGTEAKDSRGYLDWSKVGFGN